MSVITNIGNEQIPMIPARVSNTAGLPSQQARVEASATNSKSQDLIVKLRGEAVDVARIQEAKNNLNVAAVSIRQSLEEMQKANEYVQKMKAQLNAIVKMYPPYPPDSAERASYLRNFNVFRQLIDQLNFNVDNPDVEAARINEELGRSE